MERGRIGTTACKASGLAAMDSAVTLLGLKDSKIEPGAKEDITPNVLKALLTFTERDIFFVKLYPAPKLT